MVGWILLAVFILFVVWAVTVGIIAFFTAIVRKKETPFDPEKHPEGVGFLKTHTYDEHTILSRDGLKLKGWYFENPAAVRTVILCHGYRGNALVEFLPQADFYFRNGCNIFIIQQRAHMGSEGKYITFGIRESADIADWTRYVNTFPGVMQHPLFLCGISMGASSVLMASLENLPENVRGLIADCGFSDPWRQICDTARRGMHVPTFPPLYIMNFLCRCIGRFNLHERSPIGAMRTDTLPVLFLHGKADDFVLPSNTIRNYEACTAHKMLSMTEDAGHACSYKTEPRKYERMVSTFIDCAEGRWIFSEKQ